MKKFYNLATSYFNEEVCLVSLSYQHGDGLAVCAYSKSREEGCEGLLEPFATLTVNLPDWSFLCGSDTAFVDTNNYGWAVKWLEENGIARRTGLCGYSGFCEYPLMKFDLSKVNVRSDFDLKKDFLCF